MTQGAATYAIVIADTAGLIRHWNGGAEILFGYSVAEGRRRDRYHRGAGNAKSAA